MIFWYYKDGSIAVDALTGTPEWTEQMRKVEEKLRDIKYRRVAETTLPDGKWISTVWLGLDHSFDVDRPLIFETMVFPKSGDYGELDMDRYSTEEEAKKGHKKMVAKWMKKIKKGV